MVSVTQRIKQVKQPRGGYIKPKDFKTITINDGIELNQIENIHSSLVGLAVDYMSRYANGTSKEEAFRISLMGSRAIGKINTAQQLLEGITGLDDKSISNACKMVGFDVCFRVGPMGYRDVETINADKETINNIRCMVQRSLEFIKQYGPITKDGFTFQGGYTNTVSSGDGDFLTESTLWDFKVSIKASTSAHTLQLLMYYLMGMNSMNRKDFESIKNLGIFNPRLNKVYLYEINDIAPEIIEEVSSTVIGY